MDPIRLTNDFVFRYVFGRRESEPILLDLVNAVLLDADVPGVRHLTIANPINLRDAVWAKESVLDVKAIDEEGQQFDVEMQMTRDPDTVRRSLLYWAQLYCQQLERGDEYEKLRPVVCIDILDFPFFTALKGNHHWFEIRNGRDPTYVLTRDLGLHFVELTRPPTEYSPLQDWAQLIENAEKEDTDMSTLLSKNPNLERAYEEYQRCTQDRELRELALARERYLRDQASRIGSARREGIAEGERRRAMETASRLLSMGMSISQVATATGLQEDEVRDLKQGDEDGRRIGEPSGR